MVVTRRMQDTMPRGMSRAGLTTSSAMVDTWGGGEGAVHVTARARLRGRGRRWHGPGARACAAVGRGQTALARHGAAPREGLNLQTRVRALTPNRRSEASPTHAVKADEGKEHKGGRLEDALRIWGERARGLRRCEAGGLAKWHAGHGSRHALARQELKGRVRARPTSDPKPRGDEGPQVLRVGLGEACCFGVGLGGWRDPCVYRPA